MTGALLVANYQIQKQQIAKTLCESRSNPSKGCEGKCYLKKQLKKAENAENSLPGSIKEKMEMAYTVQSPFQFIFSKTNAVIKHASDYTFFLPEQPAFLEPHPPCV